MSLENWRFPQRIKRSIALFATLRPSIGCQDRKDSTTFCCLLHVSTQHLSRNNALEKPGVDGPDLLHSIFPVTAVRANWFSVLHVQNACCSLHIFTCNSLSLTEILKPEVSFWGRLGGYDHDFVFFVDKGDLMLARSNACELSCSTPLQRYYYNIVSKIILRHIENMESKIFLSNRCVFLPDVCHLSSRKWANMGCSRVWNFFSSNCSKFAVECNWNSKISQNIQNFGFC